MSVTTKGADPTRIAARARAHTDQMGRVLSDTRITMIGIQDTDVHLLRRRAWARGFTPTALKAYEDRIARRVSQLVARLEEQKGAPVAMGGWFNFFTYVRAGGHLYGRGGGVLVASQLY